MPFIHLIDQNIMKSEWNDDILCHVFDLSLESSSPKKLCPRESSLSIALLRYLRDICQGMSTIFIISQPIIDDLGGLHRVMQRRDVYPEMMLEEFPVKLGVVGFEDTWASRTCLSTATEFGNPCQL